MRLLIPLLSPASGTWGSLTRVLAVAEAATGKGHEVAFTAAGDLAVALKKKGQRVYECPQSTMFGLPKPLSNIIVKRSQKTVLPVAPGKDFGSFWFVLLLAGFGSLRYVHNLVSAELSAVRAFSPDMLFTELEPGALLVGEITGLPVATTFASILKVGLGTLPWKALNRVVGKVLRHYSRPVRTIDELCFDPAVLKIVPSIPEFEDLDQEKVEVVYVGHLLSPVQDQKGEGLALDPERKQVFVYMGTGSLGLDTVEKVLPEVFPVGGPYQVHVAAQSIATPYDRGAVQFSSYAPADKLLPHCAFTVTHGGHNTMIQSILHCVPLLMFPGPIFERRYNARKAAAAGCALFGELPDFNVAWFQEALARGEEMSENARPLAERIRSLGGAATALEAIERRCAKA